ncbi:serine/threonine protein kinase [Pseudenhygromyxa sp. WMMC2535]|uniref:protein kinase domain-containing protein n=1 Tax=Pseudenhygromyxa sp. WMMC2535 TaxID=2712867 RepID=UPI00155321C2|nr:serine/threonine protein kinase [Pseudenhygromyxa sp. WMMC2535]
MPRDRGEEQTRPIDTPTVREPSLGELERVGDDPSRRPLIAGRYRVLRQIGRGGMASVYAALDIRLRRMVALKVLTEESSNRPQLLRRFMREAQVVARMRHPNVVEVLDFGSSRAGVVYLTMELLHGEDLRRTLEREGPLPWSRVLALMLQICAGLEVAHREGVVHRDLKPGNCFRVLEDGHESIRLVDFGIALCLDDTLGERLTMEGHILGTPEYMSPEQARGEAVDRRSDIYSAGLILGEMLTGALPFEARTPSAMLAAHIYEPPRSLERLAEAAGVELPPGLEAIYARALSKNPDERYQSAAALADDLRRLATLSELGAPTREPAAQPTRIQGVVQLTDPARRSGQAPRAAGIPRRERDQARLQDSDPASNQEPGLNTGESAPLGARGGTQRGSWRRVFRRGREAKTPLYRAYCKFWRQSPRRKDQARCRVGFHHGLLAVLRERAQTTRPSHIETLNPKLQGATMNLVYALFPQRARAEHALDTLGARASVSELEREFASAAIHERDILNLELPPSGTFSLRAAVVGGLLVALSLGLSFGLMMAGVFTGIGGPSSILGSDPMDLALLCLAAALFGGVAAGIAGAASTHVKLRRLREELAKGRVLLTLEVDNSRSRLIERMLASSGAVATGVV